MYMRAFQETADSGTNDGRGARMDLSQTDRVSTHLLLFTKLEVELLHQGEPLMPAPRRTAR